MIIHEQLINAINKEYPSDILIALNPLVDESNEEISLIIGAIANILSSNDIFPKEEITNILQKNLTLKNTYQEIKKLKCNHIPKVDPELFFDDE